MAKIRVYAADPNVVNHLKTKYGLEIKNQIGGHTIMGKIKEYNFAFDCVSSTSSIIHFIVSNSTEIDYDEFYENVSKRDIEEINNEVSVPLNEDFMVQFFKSSLPSGRSIYYFTHSGIEHVFTEDGTVDRDVEDALAIEKGY